MLSTTCSEAKENQSSTIQQQTHISVISAQSVYCLWLESLTDTLYVCVCGARAHAVGAHIVQPKSA